MKTEKISYCGTAENGVSGQYQWQAATDYRRRLRRMLAGVFSGGENLAKENVHVDNRNESLL